MPLNVSGTWLTPSWVSLLITKHNLFSYFVCFAAAHLEHLSICQIYISLLGWDQPNRQLVSQRARPIGIGCVGKFCDIEESSESKSEPLRPVGTNTHAVGKYETEP